MTRTIALLFIGIALLAQAPPGPPPVPPTDQAKSYLNLTDTQIQNLQQIQQQQGAAMKSTLEQVAQKETSLRQLIEKGGDALGIGSLTLEIHALRKNAADTRKKYQDMAVAALTADQKTRLKALQDAAKLVDTIQQAAGLGLLDPPAHEGGPGMALRRQPALLRHAPETELFGMPMLRHQ